VVELDEADAALGEAAGHESAVGGEGAGLAGASAVELEGRFRLAGEVGQLRDTLACMRKAISYCAMRVCDFGVADALGVDAGSGRPRPSSWLRRSSRGTPGGLLRYEHGVAAAAERTPW
jgi:hypothetical protein